MGENLMNVCEKKELSLGDAISARNMAMSNFIGLGPPDLVVLTKDYAPPKMLPGIIKHGKHSFFHWTLGNDVSSGAAVVSYLGFLLENQEKHSLGRGVYTIEKCCTCSYNAFRKMDLRVEITVPEASKKHSGYTIEAYAMDVVGNKHEIDEAFWKETHICAMLRLIAGPPPSLRPMRIKDSLNDPVSEAYFLNMCSEFFPQARKLGNPENAYSLAGVDASNNLMTSTLCKYFVQHNRFEHMLGFFDGFTNLDPIASVPIAYAEAMLDKPSRALSLLDSSLRRKPESPSIMLSTAELSLLHLPYGLDRHIKLLDILKTSLNAISLQPNLSRGWWIMAKCLIEMNRYEWALVVMNNAPVVSEDILQPAVDRYGNPHFEKFTTPEFPVSHITTVLQDELKAFTDEFGDTSLRLLAAPGISPDQKTVYTLLSDIIARSSWDHLTKIRTRTLVRPAEMEKAKSRFMKGEEPETINVVDQRKSSDMTKQASSDKPSSRMQQSAEFSPSELESQRERERTSSESKDDPELPRSSGSGGEVEMLEGSSSREALDSSSERELHEINISGMNRKFSVPTFSISRDLDVDDALTQFLVSVLSFRNCISRKDVPTTPMNIEIASSPMIPVCDISRNMDVAFHAIFQDIKAFHAWKEEEKKLGLVGAEDIPQKMVSLRPVADWIRIAAMCERLSFTKDAARIYKMLEQHHIKALGAIVTYDSERGDIKSTLLDASALLNIYTTKYNVQQPHPVVVSAIIKLIASHGLHKVRSMQNSLPNLNPLLPPVVQDAVRWKSKGYDA